MPQAARLNDMGSAHGCFPPTNIIAASSSVFINNKPAARLGDALAPHGCGKCSAHPRIIARGSASVFINGIPAARLGDMISCGGAIMTASGDVMIGDAGASLSSAAGAANTVFNHMQQQIAKQLATDPDAEFAVFESMRTTLVNARQTGRAFCLPCQQAKT